MTENKDFERWESQFQKELKGKTPAEVAYHPHPDIVMTPYSQGWTKGTPSFTSSASGVTHSFVIDEESTSWLPGMWDRLQEYEIVSLVGTEEDTPDVNLDEWAHELAQIDERGGLRIQPPPVILDFGAISVLDKIKETMQKSDSEKRNLAVTPSHDFIWNTALLRGLQKYKLKIGEDPGPLSLESVYIAWRHLDLSGEEGQLIPLTNRLLSLMTGGLHHMIWDVREASKWQKANLNYLLNVPEILVREGRIFQDQDVIRGSGLFEELSDRIVRQLES
ncbi:MAG TPA: hypothetical protein VKZ54_12280 [Membranihabitans sp.]|nr:hypothetical protein [Membranihabitans sp.]